MGKSFVKYFIEKFGFKKWATMGPPRLLQFDSITPQTIAAHF